MNPACFFGAICIQRCSEPPQGDPKGGQGDDDHDDDEDDQFLFFAFPKSWSRAYLRDLFFSDFLILFTAFLGLGSVTVESGMFFGLDLHSTMLRTASRRPVFCNF